MDTAPATSDLTATLGTIRATPLRDINPGHASRIVRRIVDNEPDRPPLDVAAFNSAP